jgi:hypothetical protein
VARISARADDDNRHALLVEPQLSVADQRPPDPLSLRRRVNPDDANLADPTNRVNDPGSHKPDLVAVLFRHPRRDRI